MTSWINLAVQVPECLSTLNQRLAHARGLEALKKTGPMISNDMMFMTLYRGYCHAFRHFIASEVTIQTRACGFRPLFMMTNTLIQQSRWDTAIPVLSGVIVVQFVSLHDWILEAEF